MISQPHVVIISLTDKGNRLGKDICCLISAEHQHQPKPFVVTVQQLFLQHHPLIFITATGIAVRALAPVIKSKQSDPPVLVMDDRGDFIIPLLSGHQGGANEWAREMSERLSAQAVITTANRWQVPVYVLGMGCDKGCPIHYLQSVLEQTITSEQLERVVAISSIDLKQKEPALVALAQDLKLPFICYPADTLNRVADQLSYRSDIVYREVGCYGVAEAAALIHAEQLTQQASELVVAKHKNKRATCALACSYPK